MQLDHQKSPRVDKGVEPSQLPNFITDVGHSLD